MIDKISFQTKARTVDHLGREQIADAPTAISELWKNSFDAYSRCAELHIFDSPAPTAILVDDGHGMNQQEFVERWLVVGTESKATYASTSQSDRLGLRERPRQGQKGIGRLSCANLGPLLCLVSKRKDKKFVSALVDWRLFENPFLNLADIQIPVVEFEATEELLPLVAEMEAQLKSNVLGGEEGAQQLRRLEAWKSFDSLHNDEQKKGAATRDLPPSKQILNANASDLFTEQHLSMWPVWNGDSKHGTAMLIGEIAFDLEAQLDTSPDAASKLARDRLFETLSSFVDPFIDPKDVSHLSVKPEFTYAVKVWAGDIPKLIVGTGKEFDRSAIEPLEHQLVGRIDEQGVFRGQVKAFGEWLEDACVIEPPKELRVPTRSDSRTGPVTVFLSSLELDRKSSIHNSLEFQNFQELARKYAGLLMFRDGLRVMPFGRSDSDFFEIDQRRSRHAGREFWNHRNLFGRIAISRELNPNLKDKAGREGLLDNRAAKSLKSLVENILMVSARRYFGTSSDLRASLLPEIQTANKEKKAKEERAKKRKKDRKTFKANLDRLAQEVPAFLETVSTYVGSLNIEHERDLVSAQESLDKYRERIVDFRLPGVPSNLGSLEEKYQNFRYDVVKVQNCIADLQDQVKYAVEKIAPASPVELLEQQMARGAAQIHRRIRNWKAEIETLQRKEYERLRDLIDNRNKLFHAEARPVIHRVETGDIKYPKATDLLELLRQKIDTENEELFVPYVGALESLSESIDLEHLASFGMEELSELRAELDRLNSLAQLGIAVEINGHELQSYDDIIGAAIKSLPKEILDSKAGQDIIFGFEGLTDQLRFLSPLRLAGQRVQKWLSGQDITNYLEGFFGPTLAKHAISLEASTKFLASRVFDYPSRIYPVFMNLVNNSIYWLNVTDSVDPKILIDVVNNQVIVSDNGPGISLEDQEQLFSLFFTRKMRGGRGVGLYLAKANLAAGGHRIEYKPSNPDMPLKGANFAISFRGLELDETGNFS